MHALLTMPALLAVVAGYLLGSIPFGLLLTRAAGLGDVRAIGSGNIGATNVLRTGNKGLAAATLLLDPPRTGLSREAAESIVRLAPDRIIYVSCDPPTLARDARRLLDAGYSLDLVRAFDFFPNTPHVETLATLSRHPAKSVTPLTILKSSCAASPHGRSFS